MNPAVITGVIGGATLLMGLGALAFPQFVMGRFLGYAIDPSFAANFVLGEVRAAYGGVFSVIGVFTLLSARAPALHRGRLLLLACFWLGLGGGRLVGAFVDGSPGAFGWFAVGFELVVGAVLAYCSQASVDPAVVV
jgi:hypothetical protein